MYLKRVEIQGFKTFAQRTTFVFDRGITAIVGANGSGKSNLADAIRWVLGEQTVRLLRARRAEEVIFAGSAKRPPVGMAEVVLTLDNADNTVPLDAAEIAIGRRLYRDGEGEYLINGRRVRYRDVLDLLVQANLGQNAFSIVSQGMIDAALSLRPSERRALIEESTDIKRHQQRMAEAQEQLAATLANVKRIDDLLAELRPQLQRLAEQASRAQRYQDRQATLRRLLAEQYRRDWRRLATVYRAALARRDACQRLLASGEQALNDLLERQRVIRHRLAEQQAALAEQRQLLDTAIDKIRHLDADLALLDEREQGHQASIAEITRDLDWLENEIRTAEQERAAMAARLEALDHAAMIARETAAAATAVCNQREAERQALRRAITAKLQDAAAASRRLVALQEEIRQVGQRRDELVQEATTREERAREREAERMRLGQAAQAVQTRLAALATQIDALAAEAVACREAAKAAHEQARATEAEIQHLEAERRQLATRLDILSRLMESRDGLYPGVRAILAAVRRERSPLRGIVGIVASLIEAPADLDVALDVALGSHLQDLVVERWADAEIAIDWLKKSGAGRATFLPLDTIRPSPPARIAPGDGVLGVASDLIRCDSRYRRVVDQLLGRTIIVRDLATARRLLDAGRGEQIVTLAGEVVRPQGWVTGGSARAAHDSGLLAREREIRALPARLERLNAQIAALVDQVKRHQADERTALAKAAEAEARVRQLAEYRRREHAEADRLSRSIDRLDQQAEWERAQTAGVDQRLAELAARLAELTAACTAAEESVRAAERARGEAERQLEEVGTLLEAARAEAAMAQERARALASEAATVRDQLQRQDETLARLRGRVDGLTARRQEIVDAQTTARTRRAALIAERSEWQTRYQTIERVVAPLNQQVAALEAESTTLLEQSEEQRSRVADAERQLQRSIAQLERAATDLIRLRERAASDGFDASAPEDDPLAPPAFLVRPCTPLSARSNGAPFMARQLARDDDQWSTHWTVSPDSQSVQSAVLIDGVAMKSLAESTVAATPGADMPLQYHPQDFETPSGSAVVRAAHPALEDERTQAGTWSADPGCEGIGGAGDSEDQLVKLADTELARAISRLRAEIDQIGPINPNAIAEYTEIADRVRFLEEQLADLQQAERSLRSAIARLETLIDARFTMAFAQLREAFAAAFTRLFGGGKASLVIADDDARGIEILAQPPGKRLASLAALSGGERALTGIALLFALLTVNPAPFCLLDEVDAALDATNVLRFGQALRELSEQTQVLMISHNRTMIEQADVLYGITLTDDGVSRVLSLELARALELAARARADRPE